MKKIIGSKAWRITIMTATLFLLMLYGGNIRVVRSKTNSKSHPPLWRDIQKFKTSDEKSFPPKNAILFIGSSSIKRWTDVQDDFPGYLIINRGFGGSKLPDLIRYAKDIVFPYSPKQVMIYCGENDLASSDTVTARMVFGRFEELFNIIREKFPDLPIAYTSMKPSPHRIHLLPKMREGNQLIKDFLTMQKNSVFIDVYHLMLDDSDQPIPELFVDDGLHMNAKGYAVWKKVIEPFLLKG